VKRSRRRKNIVQEMETTERFYVEYLSICSELFLEPMLKNNGIISQEMVHRIFSNLTHILHIHKPLLASLESRVNKWYPCQRIGDLFLGIVEDFQSYTQYVTNYNRAIEVFDKCLENSSFEQFIQATLSNPRCKNLSIHSFLIMPVQRLPRYALLLTDVLQATEQDNEDYLQISEALKRLKAITSLINEQKREFDSSTRIREIQNSIKGKNNLVKPGRILIREGSLIRITGGKEKQEYCFLFTDILLVCVPRKKLMESNIKYDFVQDISLDSCTLEPETIENTETISFRLSQQVIHVFAEKEFHHWKLSTVAEKKGWIMDLSSTIKNLQP